MARATGHKHGGGAAHRHVPYPASNAANTGGNLQTAHPSHAAADRLREIPDSQEDPAAECLREIPDSQEDPADELFSDDEADHLTAEAEAEALTNQADNEADNLDSQTTDEDTNPEETRRNVLQRFKDNDRSAVAPAEVPKAKPTYTLRAKGFNCNGRLAAEHPDNKDDMEETATQPATQPQLDPRRTGNYSISEDDESDVICILHPSSPAALQAIELIRKQCPQHLLQNHGMERLLNYDNDELDPAGDTRPNTRSQGSSAEDINTEGPLEEDTLDEDAAPPASSSKDIALRLSSKVQNPCLGFTFGRNPLKCDIPLAPKHEHNLISNLHFRIYLNAGGILMVEDTSTNGTFVDSFQLRAKSENPKIPCRRTLNQGSIISLVPNGPSEPMRFVVGMPTRNRQVQAYEKALREYRAKVTELERQAAVAAQAAANGNMMPPPLFATGLYQRRPPIATLPAIGASTTPYAHGMGWNGGEIYNVVALIGKGAFASVYKLSTKANGDLVAAKEIDKRKYIKDGILDRKIHNEIEIMRKADHPHIVQYLGYEETAVHLYIIMEYLTCGDLTPYVHQDNLISEQLCQSVAYQTMLALDYLHKGNITHRDIKPDNILLASLEPIFVKVTDFGLSKVITNEQSFLKTFCGTLLYCAPEIYPGYEDVKNGLQMGRRGRRDARTLPYKQSVDTWAFGAVMYHLLCGQPPYMGDSDGRGQQMLQIVMSSPVDWDRLKRAGISDMGCDFVKGMLVHEPTARASDAQCLQHPWLAHLHNAGDEDVEMDAQLLGLSAISESEETDEGQELDASQLSIHDVAAQAEEEDDDLQYDEGDGLSGLFQPDRDAPRAMGFQPRNESMTPEGSQQWDEDSVQSAMFTDGIPAPHGSDPGPPSSRRLFGEIGASALGSSGVLGQDALAGLDMPANMAEGSRDEEEDTNMDDTSVEDVTDSHVTNDGISEHSLQYPHLLPITTHAGPAPSLMGTEALVGQMNMASPESGVSAPSADSKPGTPRTPKSRELSPLVTTGSKRPAQDDKTAEREALKRSKREHTPDVFQNEGAQFAHYISPARQFHSDQNPTAVTTRVAKGNYVSANATHSIPAQTQRNVVSSGANSGPGAEQPRHGAKAAETKSHLQDSYTSTFADDRVTGNRESELLDSTDNVLNLERQRVEENRRQLKSQASQTDEPHRSRRYSPVKSQLDAIEADKAVADKSEERSRRSHRSSSKSHTYGTAAGKDRVHGKGPESKEAGKKERDDRSSNALPEGPNLGIAKAVNEDQGAKGQAPKEKEKEAHKESSEAAGVKATDGKFAEKKGPADSHNGSTSSSNSSFPAADPQPDPKDPGFIRPPPIFGKLTTLPHSIISTTIKLTQRINTYGREHDNTMVFHNNMDDRVPRYAFGIVFWRAGIEAEIEKGFDWTKDDSVSAIIMSRSVNNHITVNGVTVKMGADCWQYGILYTGDIISVFDAREAKKPGTEFLIFECAFNIGVSRNRRPEGQKFELLQEREKFEKHALERARKAAKEEKKAAKAAAQAAAAATSSNDTSDAPAKALAPAPAKN